MMLHHVASEMATNIIDTAIQLYSWTEEQTKGRKTIVTTVDSNNDKA